MTIHGFDHPKWMSKVILDIQNQNILFMDRSSHHLFTEAELGALF
jgi:hypothetical protein